MQKQLNQRDTENPEKDIFNRQVAKNAKMESKR